MKKKQISKIDKYLFDLNGFIVIENALNRSEVKACNKIIDKLKNLNIMNGRVMFMDITMGGKKV